MVLNDFFHIGKSQSHAGDLRCIEGFEDYVGILLVDPDARILNSDSDKL